MRPSGKKSQGYRGDGGGLWAHGELWSRVVGGWPDEWLQSNGKIKGINLPPVIGQLRFQQAAKVQLVPRPLSNIDTGNLLHSQMQS